MAENEIYRVEIPIIVDDQSEAPLERARERVNRFEREARKRNEMIRKHFETLAKMQIEPVMRVRDQLTASVLKADRLIKRLSLEQASPVIAVQDRVSAVVTRINAILDALNKGKVDVIADMKGPLMDEIVKARAALSALNGVKAGPVAELRGELFGQLAKAMSELRKIDNIRIEPQATLRERVMSRARAITVTLRSLTSRVWTVTLQAKDKVTDVVKRIIGFVTSPLTLLGAGTGLTAAIGFPLSVAGEMDRARRSIELFSGSAEAGRRNFEELVNLAIKSPIYEVPFVVKEAGQLLAKGMNIDFVKRALNAFGNAAMYTGASLEQLELAFYGFGQIASVGTLSMEELRQVTENLNVPLNWITQELGITGDKLKELGKLGIPAKRAMEAIVRTLEKRFPVKNFNNDLFALIANIKEAGRTIVWRFGKGMLQPVIRILQDLSGALDPASEKFKQFQQKVEDFGRRVGDKLEQMYKRIKQFWGELSADPEFQRLSFGDKIIYVLNIALDKISLWLEGEGGKKVQAIFAKIGAIAVKAWIDALKGTVKTSISSFASGNILGGIGMLTLASAMGGGLVLKGIGLTGKGLFNVGKGLINAGKWIYKKVRPTTTVKVAEKVAQTAATTATGTAGKLGILSRIKIPPNIVSKLPAIEKASKFLGRAALPLAILAETIDIIRAQDKVKALLQGVGGIGAGMGGAKIGAMIGTALAPGIGTAIGGAIGGMGSYFLGRVAVGKAVDIARGGAKSTTNVPVTAKPPVYQVTIEVHAESKPTYIVNTAVNAEDVLRIIRANEKEIANQLADDISVRLVSAFNNMPLLWGWR